MTLDLITNRVEFSQRFPFDVLEVTAAGVVAPGKQPAVMQLQCGADSCIERDKVGAMQGLDMRENVFVGQLNCILHMCFILGLADSGRNHRNAIMLPEPLELTVKNRLISARLGYGTLQVIGNNGQWNAAIVVECVLASGNQILFALAVNCLHIGQQTAPEDRYEHLHLIRSRPGWIDPKLGTRVVDVHLVPGFVFDVQNRIIDFLIAANRQAKGGERIAIRHFADILLPLLLDRHAFLVHLFGDRRKTAFELFPPRIGRGAVFRYAK